MKQLTIRGCLSFALGLSCFLQILGASQADAGSINTAKKKTTVSTSQKKTTHKKTKSKKYRASGLVPPPPAYAPSILPELLYAKHRRAQIKSVEVSDSEQEPKASDTYSKHFYNRDGYEDPEPVKPNKYVTYWGKS